MYVGRLHQVPLVDFVPRHRLACWHRSILCTRRIGCHADVFAFVASNMSCCHYISCKMSPLLWRVLLCQVLRDGAEAADEVASETLGWAKEAMGLSSLKDFQ